MRGTEWAASRARSSEPVGSAVEGDAEPVDEPLLDEPRAHRGEVLGGGREAVLRAGLEDVAGEQVGGVVVAAEDDPALRPRRVGRVRLGRAADEQHVGTLLGGAEGGGEARDPGPEDQDLAPFPIGEPHTITLSDRSRAGAEWVRAPTET